MQIDHSAPAIYRKQFRRKLREPLGRILGPGQQGERDQRIGGEEIEGDRSVARMFLNLAQQLLRCEAQVLGIGSGSGWRERVLQHPFAQGNRGLAGSRLEPGAQTHDPSNQV